MRRHHLTHFALAGALAWALACSDASAPLLDLSAGTPIPSVPPTPPPVSAELFGLDPTDQSILIDDSLSVGAYFYREDGDSLDWSVSDTTIASIVTTETRRILVRARRVGEVEISARTRSALAPITATTNLTILPRSSQPAPVDVIGFTVVAYKIPSTNQYAYVPQLSLRTIGVDSVRIAGVTVDIPGLRPSGYCWSDRPQSIGKSGRAMFPPLGDGNMTSISRKDQDAPIGAEAVARITVLLSDGTAARLVASAKIEAGLFRFGYQEEEGHWLWCS